MRGEGYAKEKKKETVRGEILSNGFSERIWESPRSKPPQGLLEGRRESEELGGADCWCRLWGGGAG